MINSIEYHGFIIGTVSVLENKVLILLQINHLKFFIKKNLFIFTQNLKINTMKNGLLLLGFAVLTLASCRKEYTCECYDIYGDTTTETKKGKDAADACSTAGDVLSLKTCYPI